MAKLSIRNMELENKKVIVRVDFNVPLSEDGKILNDKRIVAALPTIDYLFQKNCSVILMSHLGRPKGTVVPSMSLVPVASYLKDVYPERKIYMADDCVGDEVTEMAAELQSGDILMLENLRFHAEETANDEEFAGKLASLADIFVQDAFGCVHRAHASTVGITKFLESGAGFLLEKELKYLGDTLSEPGKPFLAILGGAKVSDKIGVIKNLLEKVDALIIGGAMAYTFLKAKGVNVGDSRVEEDKVGLAKELLDEADKKGVKMLLPIDHVQATEFKEDAVPDITENVGISDGAMGLDIGPKTIELYTAQILESKTIVNNGPMGVFEFEKFSKGTIAIAEALADATKAGAVTIVGGGDSASAIKKAGVSDSISHVSTGGGASLEFLEGKILPGIEALNEN